MHTRRGTFLARADQCARQSKLRRRRRRYLSGASSERHRREISAVTRARPLLKGVHARRGNSRTAWGKRHRCRRDTTSPPPSSMTRTRPHADDDDDDDDDKSLLSSSHARGSLRARTLRVDRRPDECTRTGFLKPDGGVASHTAITAVEEVGRKNAGPMSFARRVRTESTVTVSVFQAIRWPRKRLKS